MNTVYKNIISVLCIFTISCVFFCAISNADDKANSANAKNAVVVNQTVQMAAQEFFAKMSPDEMRDPVVLDNFIRQYPNSTEARAAFALRYLLLKNNPNIDGYNKFIEQYPDKLQTQIALEELFELYLKKDTVPGYYDFISRHPDSIQTLVAIHHIEQIMFEFAEKCNTEESYDSFIEAFPDAPQVSAANEKAKAIAIENEQKEYNDFLKGKPNVDRFISKKISEWEDEIEAVRDNIRNNPDIIKVPSFQLRVLKCRRRGNVLHKVYEELATHAKRIQDTRNANFIADKLDEINKTIKKNHQELLEKIEKQADRICDKLKDLHKDNLQIIEEMRNGFNLLHGDLNTIHGDLVDIKSTLDDMKRHLQIISVTLKTFLTATVPSGPVDKFFKFVEIGHDIVKIIADLSRQKTDSNELFSESSTKTTVSCIAQSGYENYPNVCQFNEAAGVCANVNTHFQKIKYESIFARYIGALAATASSKYIPIVGEDLAPLFEKETTFIVERFGVPATKKVVQKVSEAGEFRWVFIGESAKETYEDFKGEFWEYQKTVVKEEEGNLLNAGGKLADAANIDRKWTDPVISAIKERNVNEIVIPWAENLEVKPEIIEFYKKHLELTSEQ